MLKQSPALFALFLPGKRLSNPFKTKKSQAIESEFKGKRFPSYFKFKDKSYGSIFERDCHVNKRSRIFFETDVENEYFSRTVEPGSFSLFLVSTNGSTFVQDYTLNLLNGIATLTVKLPSNCLVGDKLKFLARVTDPTLATPFENSFVLHVMDVADNNGGKKSKGRKPTSGNTGRDREISEGIKLPEIRKVYENPQNGEKAWDDMDPKFDRFSALRIRNAGIDSKEYKKSIYDFFVNMDNIYLKSELKANMSEPEITKARFVYGLVLLGLAFINNENERKNSSNEEEFENELQDMNIEDNVEEFSKAVSQVLLPIIEYLGDLDIESSSEGDTSGEKI